VVWLGSTGFYYALHDVDIVGSEKCIIVGGRMLVVILQREPWP